MTMLLLALLIGVVAGLRAMTAPAAVSWAAHLGWLHLNGSWLAFLGYRFTSLVFSLFALAELVTDQLPSTPSRKVPPQFGARLLMGGMSGGAIGGSGGALLSGAVAGVIGAVIGTLGGADLRGRLAAMFGSDRPAALIEDAVAIIGAGLVVSATA
jgi:uncharacterized membrane protein